MNLSRIICLGGVRIDYRKAVYLCMKMPPLNIHLAGGQQGLDPFHSAHFIW